MKLKALKAAFPHTIPILTGFLFLGMAYGFYARSLGLASIYPILTSLVVYGGSLEFVIASLLISPFAPWETFAVALLVQARHLFYGLSMVDRYRDLGAKKPYMVFSLVDETFSINCSAEPPEGVDRGLFMFFVSLLDQCYWVTGVTLGALAGSLIHFDTTGISFVMTAMFAVIFTEQWLKEKNHVSSVIGLAATALMRFVFGRDSFMIPAMLLILLGLTVLKNHSDGEEEA